MDRSFEILDVIRKHNLPIALAHKKRGVWKTYSAEEYIKCTNAVSWKLLKLGIQKGDKIASITNDRPEWNFVDLGVQQLGGVHVPIHLSSKDDDIKFILNETNSKIAFISSRFIYNRIKKLLPEIPTVIKVVTFAKIKGANHFEEFINSADETIDLNQIEEKKKKVKPDDLACILFTSGTSGKPKGVMLSHSHLSSIPSIFPNVLPYDSSFKKALSIIPLSHIAGRKNNLVYQFLGLSVYYGEAGVNITEIFREVKPDVTVLVPLMLDRMYKCLTTDNSGRIKYSLLLPILVNLTQNFNPEESIPFINKLFWGIANRLFFTQLRKQLGGNLKFIICGGSSIPGHLLSFFWAIKLPVFEIYGMTETSALISVNKPSAIKFGTVGKPYTQVEVRLAEDGELLCRGPNVTNGYFKLPEITKEAINVDGYFHTGDICEIDKEGFIKIIGRKKDIFKTAAGDFIVPTIIENKLLKSPFIHQVLITGANRNFLSALIVPDFDNLKEWGHQNNKSNNGLEDLLENSEVIAKFQSEIEKFHTTPFETEKIEKFALLSDKWAVQSGELSSIMKVKRNFIENKYSSIIDKFYQ